MEEEMNAKLETLMADFEDYFGFLSEFLNSYLNEAPKEEEVVDA